MAKKHGGFKVKGASEMKEHKGAKKGHKGGGKKRGHKK